MTTRTPTSPGLLERLAEGPVICAEGYLFEFERRGYLQAGAFVPEVVLEHPDMVRQLHREFVHAGSDVVEAFTYYGHREKLRVIGKEDLLEPLNRQALAIAAEGAAVVIGGRNEKRGEETVRAIERGGGRAEFIAVDVTRLETHEVLVQKALATFGGIDIAVPNAGILGLGSVTEIPIETWHQTIATNLHGVFYLIRAAIPAMRKRGGGAIVVNGSIAAFKAFPNHPAYCASKGALAPLIKQIAIDYGPAIRINMICPGPVDTPLLRDSARAFPHPAQVVENVARGLPLKRLGSVQDAARAALFLASDDAAWITGTALTIDGGAMSGG